MQKMRRFRSKLRKDGYDRISERTVEALITSADQLLNLYFSKHPQPRPPDVEREFKAMAKSLRRASNAANKVGPDWLRLMLLESNAQQISNDCDPKAHIAYLHRMADMAEKAAKTAAETSKSELDHLGGRYPTRCR